MDQHPTATTRELPRRIGFWGGVAITVGIIIGGGIFATPTDIAKELGHPGWILALWLIGGIIALCGGLTYAELATMYPKAGGIYVFLREGYGRWMAFVFGWTYMLITKPAAAGGIAVVFAQYFNALFGTTFDPPILTCIALTVLTIVNTFQVQVGARVAGVFTAIKAGALLAIVAVAIALQKGNSANFAPVGLLVGNHDFLTALSAVMVGILWTYDGWSDIGAVAGEVENPSRQLPRIYFLGTLGVTLLYLAVNAVYMWMMPLAEMRGETTLAPVVMRTLLGDYGAIAVAALVVISTLGSTHGSILTGARVTFAQSRDGLLFGFLGHVHPWFHTPAVSLWVQLALSCAATLYFQNFASLIGGFTLTMWLFYALAGIAVIILRIRRPDAPRPFRVPFYPVLPLVFILTAVAMTALQVWEKFQTGALVDLYISGGILLAGVPVYFAWNALWPPPPERPSRGFPVAISAKSLHREEPN